MTLIDIRTVGEDGGGRVASDKETVKKKETLREGGIAKTKLERSVMKYIQNTNPFYN